MSEAVGAGNGHDILESVRSVLAQSGAVPVDTAALDPQADLFRAGLTSFATVNLMLALEERFDIEFPDALLRRRTFESLAALSEAVAGLLATRAAA